MVINFAAGPAKLPPMVLMDVQDEIVNYNETGISVMEMSHRSPEYSKIQEEAINNLRDLIAIPDNYHVLFMQGGGTAQFAAVALNLMGRTGVADYVVTGTWSLKASKEAALFGQVNLVIPPTKKYTSVPRQNTWKLDPKASYVYYCDNETVEGVEFDFLPEIPNNVPLVADMSSNFLTRTTDITKFGVIFAGAQKNLGPAGATVVIVRNDLLGHHLKQTPSILNYQEMAKQNSLLNTPPTFSIYVMGKVFKWLRNFHGVPGIQEINERKAKLIYDVIEKSDGFYSCPVDKNVRSKVNIPFRIGSAEGVDELEKEFLKLADSKGMKQLKGHRSVGGIRASIYNAVTEEEVEQLAKLMTEFKKTKTNGEYIE